MPRQNVLQVCLSPDDYRAFVALSNKKMTNTSAHARTILVAALQASEAKPQEDEQPKEDPDAKYPSFVPTEV